MSSRSKKGPKKKTMPRLVKDDDEKGVVSKVPPPPALPNVRVLGPDQEAEYRPAMAQTKIVEEKQRTLELERVLIKKEEVILVLRKELSKLKNDTFSKEASAREEKNKTILTSLGMKEYEAVFDTGKNLQIASLKEMSKRG